MPLMDNRSTSRAPRMRLEQPVLPSSLLADALGRLNRSIREVGEKAVVQICLVRFHRSPRPPSSACDQIELQTFFDGAGWRYAAGVAKSTTILPVGLLLVVRPLNSATEAVGRILKSG